MSGPVSTKTESTKSGKLGESASLAKQSRVGHGLHRDLLAFQRAAGNQAVGHLVQPLANRATGATDRLPPIVGDVLRSGGGQPIEPEIRSFMEGRFGHDFSGVRIHTDETAGASAQALGAAAYTAGQDVYFAPGRYQTETARGRLLLAHELAHVVQQSGSAELTSTQLRPETEAAYAALNVVNGLPATVSNAVPASKQFQKVEEERAEAQKLSTGAQAETARESETGIGFQAWNVFSASEDVPPVNLGPFFYTGFSAEAEINPQIGSFKEGKAATQIRVGKLFEKGKEGPVFGVQGEIEHEFEDKVMLLGGQFTPTVKGGGKLSSEGAEVGVEGKLAGENISSGLKFSLLEAKWNKEKTEHKIHGPTVTWFVELFTKIDPNVLRKLGIPLPKTEGPDTELELKITYGFKFQPNPAWWAPRIAEAARAARLGLSAARALVVTETGELTAAGAGGLAAGVGIAYVAWVGFGLYQIELATQKGRRASAMAAFFDGYAEMLTLVTGPSAFQAGLTPESSLLTMPWKETLKEYLEAYIRGDILLLSNSPVYRAGQAAVAQDVYKYISASVARGEDARASWLSVAARLRARLGESESKRSSSIRNALAAQAASGERFVGIPLEQE